MKTIPNQQKQFYEGFARKLRKLSDKMDKYLSEFDGTNYSYTTKYCGWVIKTASELSRVSLLHQRRLEKEWKKQFLSQKEKPQI